MRCDKILLRGEMREQKDGDEYKKRIENEKERRIQNEKIRNKEE